MKGSVGKETGPQCKEKSLAEQQEGGESQLELHIKRRVATALENALPFKHLKTASLSGN